MSAADDSAGNYSLWLAPTRSSHTDKKFRSLVSLISSYHHVPAFTPHVTLNVFTIDSDGQLQSLIAEYKQLLSTQLALSMQCQTLAIHPTRPFTTLFCMQQRANLQLLALKYEVEKLTHRVLSGDNGSSSEQLAQTQLQQYMPHLSLLYDTEHKLSALQREQTVDTFKRHVFDQYNWTATNIELWKCNGTDYTKWSKVSVWQLQTVDNSMSTIQFASHHLPVLPYAQQCTNELNQLIINDKVSDTPQGASSHQPFMTMIYQLSEHATRIGHMPYTCLLVVNGNVVTTALNDVIQTHCSYRHAEFIVIEQALKYLNKYQFASAIMYAAAEPCAACATNMIGNQISTFVYGISKKQLVKFWVDPLSSTQLVAKPEHSKGASEQQSTIDSLRAMGTTVVGPIGEERFVKLFKQFNDEHSALITNFKSE